MLAIRRNPFMDLARPADGKATEPTFFRLPVNVEVKDGKYVITAPLAGFKPEEVEVTFADGALTISARHSEDKKDERDGYVRHEVVSGSFYRQIPVGEIDPSTISAQLENGVLIVTMPAPSEPKPVKIAISSGPSSQA